MNDQQYCSPGTSSKILVLLFSRQHTEDENLQSLRAAVSQFSYPSSSWECSLRWPIQEYSAKKEGYRPQSKGYKRVGNESWTINGHRQLCRVFFNLPWRHSVNGWSFVFFWKALKNNVCLKISSFYFGQNCQKTIPFGISWQSFAVQKVRVSPRALSYVNARSLDRIMARVFFARGSCVTSRDSPQMESFLVNGWNNSRITAENGVPFFCLKQRVWNSYPRLGHNFPIKRSACGGEGINSKSIGQLIQSSCMRSLYQF